MSINHLAGKGYTLLPESKSNTETEDEDEHHSQLTNSTRKDSAEMIITGSNIVRENGQFYPLDETRNLANRTKVGQNTLEYSNDNVPVINTDTHNDLWKRRDLSPLRRFCLIISILMCIATIFVFLYVLPCDSAATCPSVSEPRFSLHWDKALQSIGM